MARKLGEPTNYNTACRTYMTDETPPFSEYAQMHIDITRQTMGTPLQFDEESVMQLDEIIEKGWGKNPPAPEILTNLVLLFGSFLGEVMRRELGGRWIESQKTGRWAVALTKGEETVEANVFFKVEKRFKNGMEDSLSYFYQNTKAYLEGALTI